MGDRANIAVKQHDGNHVYLYGHWSGSAMPEILQTALRRKERWDDNPYLTRIIFCTLVKGHEADETGFGISTGLCDNEYPILVVDPDKRTVGLAKEPVYLANDTGTGKLDQLVCYKTFTFNQYIELDLGKGWAALK